MNRSCRIPAFGGVLLALLLLCGRVEAQVLGLSVTSSPSPVKLNGFVTYTIDVTNLYSLIPSLPGVVVTNYLPSDVTFFSASSGLTSATILTNGQIVVFQLTTNLFYLQPVELSVTARATAPGDGTNTVTVDALGVAESVVSVVTTVSGGADLGVSITGPPPGGLVNDWLSYTLNVTNAGPDSVASALVTNSLPDGARIISVSPTNQSFSVTNNLLSWSLSTLSAGTNVALQVTFQPTTIGTNLTLSAAIQATDGSADLRATNDTASTTLRIGDFLPGNVVPQDPSPVQLDPQTGLMEQTVKLLNQGTNQIGSVRLFVLGLTNRLVNAVGTNNADPFVVYSGTIDPGKTVDLVLEYFVPSRQPLINLTFAAAEVPPLDLSPPAGSPFSITLVTNLPSGALLIEFPSSLGSRYSILYSDHVSFTNAMTAQPPIVAPADRVQWIDNGPPNTVSRPANVAARFYKVLLNQ